MLPLSHGPLRTSASLTPPLLRRLSTYTRLCFAVRSNPISVYSAQGPDDEADEDEEDEDAFASTRSPKRPSRKSAVVFHENLAEISSCTPRVAGLASNTAASPLSALCGKGNSVAPQCCRRSFCSSGTKRCMTRPSAPQLRSRGRVIVFSLLLLHARGSVPRRSPPLFPFCCQPNSTRLRRPPPTSGPAPVFAQHLLRRHNTQS